MEIKKKVVLFCFWLLVCLGICYFFLPAKNIPTFRQYSPPPLKIDKNSIDILLKNEIEETVELKINIINIVLDSIQYEKWKNFSQYIDMKIYRNFIVNTSSPQLLISLNLSKDLGVIAIFEEINGQYVFHSKIENIAPIEEIKFIPHPTKENNIIAVYQILDERFGSFFYERFLQLYYFKDSNFLCLWEKTLYYEEVYKESWINPEAGAHLWNKAIEETEIDFLYGDQLKINTITSLKKYTADSNEFPQDNEFSLKEELSYHRAYYWHDQYQTFVLGELTKDVFLSDIALLEDMEYSKEWLFGFKNPYYKTMNMKGELLYLPKSKFQRLFVESF